MTVFLCSRLPFTFPEQTILLFERFLTAATHHNMLNCHFMTMTQPSETGPRTSDYPIPWSPQSLHVIILWNTLHWHHTECEFSRMQGELLWHWHKWWPFLATAWVFTQTDYQWRGKNAPPGHIKDQGHKTPGRSGMLHSRICPEDTQMVSTKYAWCVKYLKVPVCLNNK